MAQTIEMNVKNVKNESMNGAMSQSFVTAWGTDPERYWERPDYVKVIADKAMEQDTGARALRSIIEEFMLDIMYDIPSKGGIDKFVITKEMVELEEEKTETQMGFGEHAELIQLPKKTKSEIA